MPKTDVLPRTTGFTARQIVSILVLLIVAVLLAPVGAHAAATLFTLQGGSSSNLSQQAVTAGAAQVQTFPGVPVRFPSNGTRSLAATTKLFSVKNQRIAFSDLVVANPGDTAGLVQLSVGTSSSMTCGTITGEKDVFTILAPAGQTTAVKMDQALVLPQRTTSSTAITCISAHLVSGGFVYLSWVAYAADPGGTLLQIG